jgi:hypothetical protein
MVLLHIYFLVATRDNMRKKDLLLLPLFINIRCFRFVKQMYLDKF